MTDSVLRAADGFPLLGEPLAIDLVNTLAALGPGGALVDLIATPDRLRAWLDVQADRLGGDADSTLALVDKLANVLVLREAIRALLRAAMAGEPPDSEALAIINAASAAAPVVTVLEWSAASAPRAVPRHQVQDPAQLPLAVIARSAIDLLASEQRQLLRACGGPGCVLLFLATNARRRWCSAGGCGNRVRVARHYRRRHMPDAAPAARTGPGS